MYLSFYGFKEMPFNMTPDSRYFFESPKHTEALSTLLYAVQVRKGFVVVTGDIGSGKTTVCRTFLNRLDQNAVKTALIVNTHISGKDLLITVLEELGVEIPSPNASKSRLLSVLNAYLIEQLRHDVNVVLIIDEAQNLKSSVLEEVRMLSNLETESEKLVQIILMGQPELKQKLSVSRLEQLRQRVAVFYHLTPLAHDDMKKYIRHRLKIASGTDREYFTEEALDQICRFTRGVPRVINQVCDSALLSGYIYEKAMVDAPLMEEVIKESPMAQLSAGKKNFWSEHSEPTTLELEIM
ncbi:MAG: AAA family ATPase [Candidatus Omnitrophica bacterium]|nr:AAA family ATPase [Candidatus Omnitrophota bacterium]